MRRTIHYILLAMSLACSTFLRAQQVAYRSFDHYNNKVAEFAPLRDIDSKTIVMLGNSLTENGGDWAKRLATSAKVVNRGIIGDNTIGMVNRLCQITPYHPRAIFLMAGINDMSHGLPPQEVANLVITLIDSIRRQSPTTLLLVESILPINESTGRWKTLTGRTDDIPIANQLIQAYCKPRGIIYIDIFRQMKSKHDNALRPELTTDGLHLNAEGYELWSAELRRYIKD